MNSKTKTAVLCVIMAETILSGCVRRYRVEGMVLDVDREQKTMLVSHRAIPRYMGAMTMSFPIREPKELASLHAGDQIEFQLVVKKQISYAESVRTRSNTNASRVGDDL